MYKFIKDNLIENLNTGIKFPVAPGNRDYEEYLVWEAIEGNTIQPADPPPPPPVPLAVTMRQARIALHRAGLLTAVDAAINSMSEPAKTEAQIEWEFSNTVERNGNMVALLAPVLGLSSTDVDNLFITAAAL